MRWLLSWRADPLARAIADRHYNRQNPDSPQFVPPGRCFVLRTDHAFWVTSWPFAEHVKHAWAGAWVCSAFRVEGGCDRASDLIVDAVAATRAFFGKPPALGMVTFVDETKVRHKRDPGRCFLRAGFTRLKERTKEQDLLVFQLRPEDMPAPREALGTQLGLVGT